MGSLLSLSEQSDTGVSADVEFRKVGSPGRGALSWELAEAV